MNETDKNISNLQHERGNEIILYQPDSTLSLDVRVENETVWLTQQQIADLFGVKQPAISKHLKNYLKVENLLNLQFIPFWNILPWMVNLIIQGGRRQREFAYSRLPEKDVRTYRRKQCAKNAYYFL